MSFSRGQLVRVLAHARVASYNSEFKIGRKYRVYFEGVVSGDESESAWFPEDQLEVIDEQTKSPPDRAWRDVCADMIRLGNDDAAFDLFIEHSALIRLLPNNMLTVDLNHAVHASFQNHSSRTMKILARVVAEIVRCADCTRDPDPRGWSACAACRTLNSLR